MQLQNSAAVFIELISCRDVWDVWSDHLTVGFKDLICLMRSERSLRV